MVKNLKRMKKQVERERGAEEAAQYDFFPTTFILPGEYQMFVEEFKRSAQVSASWNANTKRHSLQPFIDDGIIHGVLVTAINLPVCAPRPPPAPPFSISKPNTRAALKPACDEREKRSQ